MVNASQEKYSVIRIYESHGFFRSSSPSSWPRASYPGEAQAAAKDALGCGLRDPPERTGPQYGIIWKYHEISGAAKVSYFHMFISVFGGVLINNLLVKVFLLYTLTSCSITFNIHTSCYVWGGSGPRWSPRRPRKLSNPYVDRGQRAAQCSQYCDGVAREPYSILKRT